MRSRLLTLTASASLLIGCQVVEERRLPTARLEIEARPEVGQGAVTFDFAKGRTAGGVVYGHKVSFVATEKVCRVAFEQDRPLPETWSLTWEDKTTHKTHSISVAIKARGDHPEIEVLGPAGRSLGSYIGAAVQLYLLPDGSISVNEPPREGRGGK